MEYLISRTPDGLIKFVTLGYERRTEDTVIFENYGILDEITGDILADRGINNNAYLLKKRGCKLSRAPSVAANS